MDPFSALSVATAVVQFIDFSSELIGGSREIYSSVSGQLQEHAELEQIGSSLANLSNDLKVSLSGNPPTNQLSPNDRELHSLCKQCEEIADELLEVLAQLKTQDNGKLKTRGERSQWKSFLQALRSVWARERIGELQKRLDRFRAQLVLAILVSLREPVSIVKEQQLQVKGKISRIAENNESLGQLFLSHVADSQRWRTDLLDAIRSTNRQDGVHQDSEKPQRTLTHAFEGSRASAFAQLILHKLRFREMPDRFERIAEAHERTFRWLFEEPQDKDLPWESLVQWLQDDSRIYWITGKPGSGKSTLMKYIRQHHNTRELLRSTHVTRRKESQVIIAGFYFWNSGTDIQMSQVGLMRTLLHELIRQCQDLLPVIFPDLWEAYYLFDERPYDDWTWYELIRTFKNLIKAARPSRWFFLMIDGLDEFSGNHSELIAMLEDVARFDNIKLCLASRPWTIFEDAFKHTPSLRLEDLTFEDIRYYVDTTLKENPGYCELEVEEPEFASLLVEEITRKSSGVFLWVKLVVASLSGGITNGDRISDLQRRLDALPSELEELFKKIIESLNSQYMPQAAKLFILVRIWRKTLFAQRSLPLSLLQLSFADLDDTITATEYSIQPLTAEQRKSRSERMRRRLNSRSNCLLEAPRPNAALDWSDDSVESDWSYQTDVQYLHRTVKDYIEKEENWTKFCSWAGPSYDPYLFLSASFLMRMKTTRSPTNGLFWHYIKYCVIFAKQSVSYSKQRNIEQLTVILDQLDEAARRVLMNSCASLVASNVLGSQALFKLCPSTISDVDIGIYYVTDFLNLAVHYQLDWYVESKIQKEGLKEQIELRCPLLFCAVEGCTLRSPVMLEGDDDSPNISIIQALLDAGADPNCSFNGVTALAKVAKYARAADLLRRFQSEKSAQSRKPAKISHRPKNHRGALNPLRKLFCCWC